MRAPAQGKTSRWAIAWSFAVDRNKANVPLRSHAGAGGLGDAAGADAAAAAAAAAAESELQATAAATAAAAAAPAAPRRAVRATSFAVAASAGEARRLLQALAALLGREGAVCSVDAGSFLLTAELPLQGGGDGEPAAKRARPGSTGTAAGGGGVQVRVQLSQQQRGSFTISASIANDTSDLAARRFTEAMHAVREDVGLMWQLKGQ